MAPAFAQTPNASERQSGSAGVKMQDPAPGDHWTFEVRDDVSGTLKVTRTHTITEVSKNEITVRVDTAGVSSPGNIIYDRSWAIVRNGFFRYTPNDGTGLRLPLAVGAHWTFTADAVNGRYGTTFKRSGTSRVVKQESITTKAGTFDAFVIETEFTGRSVQDRTLVNQSSLRTWFAPDIGHWVKRSSVQRRNGHVVDKETAEVTEYGRKSE